jgi:hypothetical protein
MKKQLLLISTCFGLALLTNACWFEVKPRKPIVITGTPKIKGRTAEITGNIFDYTGNLQSYGHVWSDRPNPEVNGTVTFYSVNNERSDGTDKADDNQNFKSTFRNVILGNTYYVKGFIIVDGQTYYGNQESTDQTGTAVPELSSKNVNGVSVNNIAKTAAQFVSRVNGTSTSEVVDYGFVYSEISTTPTLDAADVSKESLFKTTDTKTGAVNYPLDKTVNTLAAGKKYSVRAYVIVRTDGTNDASYSLVSTFATATN